MIVSLLGVCIIQSGTMLPFELKGEISGYALTVASIK